MDINSYLEQNKYKYQATPENIDYLNRLYDDLSYNFEKYGLTKEEYPAFKAIRCVDTISELIKIQGESFIIYNANISKIFGSFVYAIDKDLPQLKLKSIFQKLIAEKLLIIGEYDAAYLFADRFSQSEKWELEQTEFKNNNRNPFVVLIQIVFIICHEIAHYLVVEKIDLDNLRKIAKRLLKEVYGRSTNVEQWKFLIQQIAFFKELFKLKEEELPEKSFDEYLAYFENQISQKDFLEEIVCDKISVMFTYEFFSAAFTDDKKRIGEGILHSILFIRFHSYINFICREYSTSKPLNHPSNFLIDSLFRYFHIRNLMQNEYNIDVQEIETKYNNKILNGFLEVVKDLYSKKIEKVNLKMFEKIAEIENKLSV